MDVYRSLSHTVWDCKFHIVFISKCRRKPFYAELRRHRVMASVNLRCKEGCEVIEGHLMPDHVHMMIAIPSKPAVSQDVGYIKGKSAIHLARVYGERKCNFVG